MNLAFNFYYITLSLKKIHRVNFKDVPNRSSARILSYKDRFEPNQRTNDHERMIMLEGLQTNVNET